MTQNPTNQPASKMKTQKELELLEKLRLVMLALIKKADSKDPFEVIDNIDKGVEVLRDLVECIDDDRFRSEAQDKLDNMLKIRENLLNSI